MTAAESSSAGAKRPTSSRGLKNSSNSLLLTPYLQYIQTYRHNHNHRVTSLPWIPVGCTYAACTQLDGNYLRLHSIRPLLTGHIQSAF